MNDFKKFQENFVEWFLDHWLIITIILGVMVVIELILIFWGWVLMEEKRYYLKHYDRCFSTGCYVVFNADRDCFEFDGFEDDTFFDGKLVNFDENGEPYIIEEESD